MGVSRKCEMRKQFTSWMLDFFCVYHRPISGESGLVILEVLSISNRGPPFDPSGILMPMLTIKYSPQ